MNRYRQQTKMLRLPVVGDGDRFDPALELRKYQIIENMLLAGMKGLRNCLFSEGDIILQKQPDGTFTVSLLAGATGIVGGAYFSSPSQMQWAGLQTGRTHYLYLTGTPNTIVDPSQMRTAQTEHRNKDMENSAILMAKVDLRNEPSLDRYPTGKLYSRDLAKHSSDSDNPHGESMSQDELIVRKKLVLSAQDGAGLEIRVKDGSVFIPAASIIPSVMDFTTAGPSGAAMTAMTPVAFVMVSRVHTGDLTAKLGEVSIGYDDANNQCFSVFNTGDAGILMRALIFHK